MNILSVDRRGGGLSFVLFNYVSVFAIEDLTFLFTLQNACETLTRENCLALASRWEQ